MARENELEILVRLKLEQAKRDQEVLVRVLIDVGKSGKKAGAEVKKGMDSGQRGVKDLQRSAIDLEVTLRKVGQVAGQIGGLARQGAAARDTSDSFDFLAKRAGLSSQEMITAMQRASRGTLDANRIMASSNLLLGAKFETSVEDMSVAMEFARLKSKQFGLSTEEAFSRLVRGAVKSEVELLDELGIMLKLNDSLKIYASSLGISTKELDSTQRSQAIWNAILIEARLELKEHPAGIDKATDAYERLDSKFRELTEGAGRLLDSLGPVGVAIYGLGKASVAVMPMLTAYLLLKNRLTIASIKHKASLGAESAGMLSQARAAATSGLGKIASLGGGGLAGGLAVGAAAAAVAAAVLAAKTLDDRNKQVRQGVKDTEAAWSKYTQKLQQVADSERGAMGVAQDYVTARQKVSDQLHVDGNLLEDLSIAFVRNRVNLDQLVNAEQEQVQQLLVLSSKSYPEYRQAITTINEAQTVNALKIQEVSEEHFRMQRLLEGSTTKMLDFVKATRESSNGMARMIAFGLQPLALAQQKQAEETEKAAEVARRQLPDALTVAQKALQGAGMSSEKLAAIQDQLAIALGKTSSEQITTRDNVKLLTEVLAMNIITADEFVKKMADAAAGTLELSASTRLAVREAQALESTQKSMSSSLSELVNAQKRLRALEGQGRGGVEGAEKEHQDRLTQIKERAATDRQRAVDRLQQTLENASRNHKARIEDIERRHRERVQDIERNFTKTVAQASIERDALAILQARERRGEELSDAEQDRQRSQADEGRSYGEQVRAAQAAYQQRLIEIDRALAEEGRRERAAQVVRLADLREFHTAEYEEVKAQLKRLQDEYDKAAARRRNVLGRRGGGDERTRELMNMQHGGSGIVTGPATFKVEPGVTEAYWFSGQMGSAPQRGALRSSPQQVRVGGRISLDAAGLPERIVAAITGPVSDAVLNSIAGAIEGAVPV